MEENTMKSFNLLIAELATELDQLESFKQCATYNRDTMPDGPTIKGAIMRLSGCTISNKDLIKDAINVMVKAHDAYGYECEGGCPVHTIKSKLLELLDD